MSHDVRVYRFDGKTHGGSDLQRGVLEQVDVGVTLAPIAP